jgi:hypothetical protein
MRLFLASLLLAALELGAQPAQIILLRHAEKPDDKAEVHLSSRGRERAQALVALLGRHSPFTTNTPVAALYATRVTRHDRSQRTGETLAPLGQDLGLPVNTAFGSGEYASLAQSILRNATYRRQTVIICWTHDEIGKLAEALGVKPGPPRWKDKVFDRLWVIRLENGGATLRDVPQRLLAGDPTR